MASGTDVASSGLFRRRTHTPAQTMTNASSVPMFTSSPRSSMGMRMRISPRANSHENREIYGVRKRRWIAAGPLAAEDRRATSNKTRGTGRAASRASTLVRPQMAPALTKKLPQRTPVASMRDGDRSRHVQCRLRHHASQQTRHQNVENRADHQRADDPDRHIALADSWPPARRWKRRRIRCRRRKSRPPRAPRRTIRMPRTYRYWRGRNGCQFAATSAACWIT